MWLSISAMLQQTIQTPDNWFQYGIAGALVFLMILILKYIMQRDKQDANERQEREARLALQRSEMYREDNKLRDQRWMDAVGELREALEKVDANYKDTSQKFIDANRENIEKFIGVVNKVMDQNSYVAEVLTGLKSTVERLTTANQKEFETLKNSILEHLNKITLNYEIKRKD